MDNPEKLTIWGTQDEEKQNKNTTQYVLGTTILKQTQITYKRHVTSNHIAEKGSYPLSLSYHFIFMI